ncbi:testis-specific serine/threonine-protein kinase 6 [Astyanax mexicanus]|uniref:testis-specific serine/threonine-protein kinase 6 n=1 Tax=Astyanax mexicanus TaxID=7994 RepID=UPI000BBDF7AD|nr:testis-specific serine/threonine-protein kinase 6 [Astyanax mexicanus]
MLSKALLRGLGYKVIHSIGKGSHGEVVLAKSWKYPENVAIKIVDKKVAPPDFVSKFLPQELSVIKTIEHPNIIKVHKIHEISDRLVFIVMELAVKTLEQKIGLCRLPNDEAKVLFSQLASAVNYLHERDIVHRDLKCPNVLLTAEDTVKLSDFSFSGYYKGLSKTFVCSPAYAAPEVLNLIPYDPKKSDVWSLGVTLNCMVTGSIPFNNEDMSSFLSSQRAPIHFPFHIILDKQCRDLITDMLKYNPLDRPSISEVANHPWLQSRKQDELSETPDESLFVAGSSLKMKKAEDIQQQLHSTKEQDKGVLSPIKSFFKWIAGKIF